MRPAMNKKARALGMKSAHFVDPTGLSSRTWPARHDLAKLVDAAATQSHHPHLLHARQPTRCGLARSPLEFRNTNSLVRKPDWDIVVQKTGYTSEAGRAWSCRP